jgi:DNA-binding HxlR family transcriptional regulator
MPGPLGSALSPVCWRITTAGPLDSNLVGTHRPPGGSPIPHVPPPKRHPYDQWSPDARALDLVGDKWTLLIVRDLASGPRRFVELQRVLPGISTEQLRSRLNRMVADGMLTRKRYREVPPRVDYELTERARELMPVLGELARWGYEWAWSPPRATESVDLGAIFRLGPGLLGSSATAATLEFVVSDPEVRSFFTFTFSDQGTKMEERQADGPAARVTGSTTDWVRAFSPERDRSGLEITGDHQLADTVLDGLVTTGRRAAHRTREAA